MYLRLPCVGNKYRLLIYLQNTFLYHSVSLDKYNIILKNCFFTDQVVYPHLSASSFPFMTSLLLVQFVNVSSIDPETGGFIPTTQWQLFRSVDSFNVYLQTLEFVCINLKFNLKRFQIICANLLQQLKVNVFEFVKKKIHHSMSQPHMHGNFEYNKITANWTALCRNRNIFDCMYILSSINIYIYIYLQSQNILTFYDYDIFINISPYGIWRLKRGEYISFILPFEGDVSAEFIKIILSKYLFCFYEYCYCNSLNCC